MGYQWNCIGSEIAVEAVREGDWRGVNARWMRVVSVKCADGWVNKSWERRRDDRINQCG